MEGRACLNVGTWSLYRKKKYSHCWIILILQLLNSFYSLAIRERFQEVIFKSFTPHDLCGHSAHYECFSFTLEALWIFSKLVLFQNTSKIMWCSGFKYDLLKTFSIGNIGICIFEFGARGWSKSTFFLTESTYSEQDSRIFCHCYDENYIVLILFLFKYYFGYNYKRM